jgi:hypothetical protein
MAAPSVPGTSDSSEGLASRKHSGFLHIERHGNGASSVYLVSFHRLEGIGGSTRPLAVEGAEGLLQLLEHLGIDFKLAVVRGALSDTLRLGSATIPELMFTDGLLAENGMVFVTEPA